MIVEVENGTVCDGVLLIHLLVLMVYIFQLEICCKMMESHYQDEAVKLQQQHDADVQKVHSSFSYC